ncbi:formimidoylglutamate deiminase [Salinihabitans flavidus]|uniref:Formimidoylglutamate deiminase n=1 Tax=Salinihabitans flavidus TaxID=569882 RepID=A0A1H8S3F4_9RHOB|nr:formimidoylglutamate deiminase [Salinihabitans flavidus]SEO72944.1 formimidoylglutamate deiminase [Salinihabitans flavidus]
MSQTIFARDALLPEGWARDVTVQIGSDGRISSVTQADAKPDRAEEVGILLPAPANIHSHGFQRAMAGLTEGRGDSPTDSFWTWRRVMYRFLDQLTPEHVEAITAFVQMEMLEAGYAASVEFHYLHHQPGGVPYASLSEMSERVAGAADASGIGLTLLPVLYEYGGLDQRALGPGQIRFGNDPERFAILVEGAERALSPLPHDTVLGVAPHSLRAVSSQGLSQAATLRPDGPIHMHIAEQIPEIEEVFAATGVQPMEWLLDNAQVDARWCLIHCTHMTHDETVALARTGATAGLCPITESSLGDGIFNGIDYLSANGRIGIGSDSNIRISLSEELRTLEYSQRLTSNRRAVFATPDKSTGRMLFEHALKGGAAAAGRDCGAIAPGKQADLLTLDPGSVHLVNRTQDQLLDSFIFAGDDSMVRDVWSAGRHVVRGGQHKDHDRLTAAYRGVIERLSSEI